MMTVNEVSKLTGVSIRTLQYYDTIGLLKPSEYTESGYRLYDDTALERLQQIELLSLKKEHLENLINFARGIKWLGVKQMDFTVFDTKKIDEYSKRAKEQWGKTPEYKEFEEKAKNWTDEEQQGMMNDFMQIFAEFGQMMTLDPADEKVQLQVKKLQNYISEHFYSCSNEILGCLGKMYAGGGEFTENIDKVGGSGTAVFASKAIEFYCE
ncbi:MAG: MerR family transcriptional regulator [Roseburia sp.]